MKSKKIISLIIGIVVVAAVSSGVYFYHAKQKNEDDIKSHWIVSGPFAVDKARYKLGESVFLSVNGLKPNEAGDIVFLLPNGKVWATIPFNGTLKSNFNYYFKPDTSARLEIYEPEDLVGTWKVVFQGVSYNSLSFDLVHEYILGAEKDIVPIPRPNATQTIGPTQK